jgi:hypothetical protein
MNYLFRYMCLLTDAERTAVEQLELTERERQVLVVLLGAVAAGNASKDVLLEQLAMSGAHFDKICSVLLDKIYAVIVPEGGTALLYDLNRRSLFGHFRHQMKKQEKHLLNSGVPAQELSDFYFACLAQMQRISRVDYDDKFFRETGAKYLASKPHRTPGDDVLVEAGLINSFIQNTAALGRQVRLGDEIEQRLNALAVRARELDEEHDVEALHQCYRAWVAFYTSIDSQPAMRLAYLQRVAALSERYPDRISEEEKVLTLARIAEAHYAASEFETAARLYAELFETHDSVMPRDFYHTTKYVQVLIILGACKRAEKLLEQRFGVFVQNRAANMATMGSLSYAKLYLRSGQLDRAKYFIDLGFELIAKNFYIQYEIELRILETVYFYLAGDEEFAETLSVKHLKYLQSKGFTLRTSRYYPWFFTLIAAIISEKTGVRPFTAKQEAKLRDFDEGPARLYGIFLRMMRGEHIPCRD